ncbi:MAG TPA: response regulator [Stellaceae bacterium]|nr:response regulator [Stellaceae bacterium]
MVNDESDRGLSGQPAPAGRKCVLVVEDNPLNMKLFAAMVAAQGYLVLQATDGPLGLDLARRQHPDLIVMDVQLPGLSGLEVMRSLKADEGTSDIPIIATSAYTQQDDVERLRASGCDGFMAKPIAIAEFLAMIEACIAERRAATW